MSNRTMSYVLLIVGLIIGGAIGYVATPKGVSQEDFQALQAQNTALATQVSQLQQEVLQLGGMINNTETVNLAYSDALGNYFVDINGFALYYYAKDVPGSGASAATTGTVATNWPPFYAQTLVLPTGVNAADFGSITRSDGKMQTTYKGWPLYRYIQDTVEGDAKGDGVINLWWVMSPNYNVMLAYTEDAGLHMVTVDDRGIYYFASDLGYDFTNQTLSYPPRLTPIVGNAVYAPSYATKGYFSVMVNDLGLQQITYRGWPLYTFNGDLGPGDHNGDGYSYSVQDLSNVGISEVPMGNVALQFLMKPDYDLMIAWNLVNGTYVTDGAGMTLYYFTDDSPDVSRATPAQLNNWPPFSTQTVVAPNLIVSESIKVFTKADGTSQVEIYGHPLYYFIKDKIPGDRRGENILGKWYYLDPFAPPPTS